MQRLKSLSLPEWAVPLGLLIVCILAFGLLISSLGFYLDDWYTIWFAKTLGVTSFPAVYAEDRPVIGYFFTMVGALLGQAPLAWQAFNLVCRWLGAVAFWWALRQVWPKAARAIALAAFLFAVYPGFKQHWISVTYTPIYFFLALTLFSLGGTAVSIRRRRWFWPWMLVSLVTSLYSMFSIEFYFGLEFLRPVILWIVLQPTARDRRDRLVKTLVNWLPYFVGLSVYWVWRTFFFVSTHHPIEVFNQLSAGWLPALANLAVTVVKDVFNSSLVAWSQIFSLPYGFNLTQKAPALFWGVVFAAGLFALAFLWRLYPGKKAASLSLQGVSPLTGKKEGKSNGESRWGWQFVAFGLLALAVGSIPFLAAGLPITTVFPADRFTLAMIPGASLLLVGLIELIFRPYLAKVGVIALVVALSTGSDYQLSRSYQQELQSMQDIAWQLAWRAPGLKPGTILVTHDLGLDYYSETSLTAIVNWIYAPDIHTPTFDFFVYFSNDVLGSALLQLPPGASISRTLRGATFNSSTDQILGIYDSAPGCLHVLDPESGETQPLIPPDLKLAIPVSNLNQILPQADPAVRPPAAYFGEEPAHGWCYFYEKAELARQMGDWQTVVSLGDQAASLGLKPAFPSSEWLPFIEGYAHLGDWEKAQQLSQEMLKTSPLVISGVCEAWQRIARTTQPGPAAQDIIRQILAEAGCS